MTDSTPQAEPRTALDAAWDRLIDRMVDYAEYRLPDGGTAIRREIAQQLIVEHRAAIEAEAAQPGLDVGRRDEAVIAALRLGGPHPTGRSDYFEGWIDAINYAVETINQIGLDAAQPAAPAEGTDALPVDLSDYMAGYRQAQADLTGLDAAPAEEPTE